MHGQFVRRARGRLPAGPVPQELSRTATPVLTNDARFNEFAEVHLDDYSQATAREDQDVQLVADLSAPLQRALRDAYAEWGVPRSEPKALTGPTGALSREGYINGQLG